MFHRMTRQISKQLAATKSEIPEDVKKIWSQIFYDEALNEKYKHLLGANERAPMFLRSTKRILFFATPKMLDRLASATRVMVDGTFELAQDTEEFKELFDLSCMLNPMLNSEKCQTF